MRANLGRHARRILVRRAATPSCALFTTPARRKAIARPIAHKQFHRSFIGTLFSKPPREIKPPVYEPGYVKIMIWRSRTANKLRPPSRKELLEAWKKFMQFKRQTQTPLNTTQAIQCRLLLQWLAEDSTEDDQGTTLSSRDLAAARDVITKIEPYEKTQFHLDFAKALYEVWESGNYTGKVRSLELQWGSLIKSLSLYGGSHEALEMLYAKWDDPEYFQYYNDEARLVEVVAQGLAQDGHEKELVDLMEHATSHGIPYDAGLQEIITTFFADRDRVAETKHWFSKTIDQKLSSAALYRSIASFARRNNEEEWATGVLQDLIQTRPRKRFWDAILPSQLLLGKSIKEMDATMSQMVDSTKHSPDIKTINSLVRVALETQDLNLASALLALGAEKGLSPDGETFLIVWHLRLKMGDIAGCHGPYAQVQYLEPWANDSAEHIAAEYTQVLNDYLIALSQQSPPDFPGILKVLDAAEHQQARLLPQTVASLSLRFLENEQHFDVMDILMLTVFTFSEQGRDVVQSAFVNFCLDSSTSTSRAWGAYQILNQVFDELTMENRAKLMRSFLDRRRPDMAASMFKEMWRHRDQTFRPTADMYVMFLEGMADCPSSEHLEDVHKLLRMETSFELDARLLTGLIIAYAACGRPMTAWEFWIEITRSREGPSYASLRAVFWSLEIRNNGWKLAKDIWQKIENMDLEVPADLYNAYVAAIAGGGQQTQVRDLITAMPSVVGTGPDLMTLGLAYNAFHGQTTQSEFQDWAKKKYPGVWDALLKRGRRMSEDGLCHFKIKRPLHS